MTSLHEYYDCFFSILFLFAINYKLLCKTAAFYGNKFAHFHVQSNSFELTMHFFSDKICVNKQWVTLNATFAFKHSLPHPCAIATDMCCGKSAKV